MPWQHNGRKGEVRDDTSIQAPQGLSVLPIFEWVSEVRGEWLRLDVIAGLTTAAVVIPGAMAYATIAGLPVQVGLYTDYLEASPVSSH